MTARQLLKVIKAAAKAAGLEYQQMQGRGSHLKVLVGKCGTTVPIHQGEDIRKGLLGQIQRDLEPCLGERWLQ